jgi:hypothetical protein
MTLFILVASFGKFQVINRAAFNPLASELDPSAQRCLPRFFIGDLIFKGLTARRLCKSFGVKELIHILFIAISVYVISEYTFINYVENVDY